MAGADDENPPPPPITTPTQQALYTVSIIKLFILKKGEYDIWAMKMEHYLAHIDYPIWEVIQRGNGPVSVSTDTNGQIKVLPPKTAEEILARERERKARTTLLMAIPEDHLAKFHKMTDAKEMWEAIKSRFGGNDESKKMKKYILKQQFESFSVSPLKMLIRSSLGLYLLPGPKVFETDVKGSTGSSSRAQNVAFVSSESTSNTNDISTADGATISSGYKSQKENSSSYTDKLMHSFFANQSSGHFARECRSKGNQDIRRRDAGNTRYKAKDNERRPGKPEEPKALVTLDGDGVDWTGHAEDEQENFALIAYSHSGSDTEMSAKDKSGLGYGDQIHEGVFSYENEVFESVFDSRSSDVEDSSVNDRFAKVKGMHAVPPPMTGIYTPPKSDFGIDNDSDSCESNSNVETLESVPKPVVIEPKVVSQPKVWSDAPIIEEYESDSDEEYVIKSLKEQETPSFAFVNTVKHIKTHRETVKEQNICNQGPKVNKRDWNGLMSKKIGLGYGFTRKACFVCGSFGHLIRDCDFHEKRMAKQVKDLKHQNKFVPTAVLIRTGEFPVNTARYNFNSQAVSTSAARKANVVQPIMNDVRPRPIFNKTRSPIRRPFNRTTAPKTDFSNQKVNTARDKAVSVVGGKRETAVKTSAGCNWRSKRHYWNKFSKYNGGSNSRKCDDPQQTLKGKDIVDSGCSRHMTGNKAYLVEYQDYNGGPVAFVV
ncbi:ribonuclease H-like domain-containing protein [Tanacetum coccineum]